VLNIPCTGGIEMGDQSERQNNRNVCCYRITYCSYMCLCTPMLLICLNQASVFRYDRHNILSKVSFEEFSE